MAWLIMRVEPCENDTLPERDMKPVVQHIAVRHPLSQPTQARVREVAEKYGYEVPEDWPVSRASKTDWPLTAFTYVSQNKEGIGRSASQLWRVPIRKRQLCEGCGEPCRPDQDENSIVQCSRCYDQDEEDER